MFTIYLLGRSSIEALHPDFAMLSPGGTILNVYDAEKMHWLRVALITRISCKRPLESRRHRELAALAGNR